MISRNLFLCASLYALVWGKEKKTSCNTHSIDLPFPCTFGCTYASVGVYMSRHGCPCMCMQRPEVSDDYLSQSFLLKKDLSLKLELADCLGWLQGCTCFYYLCSGIVPTTTTHGYSHGCLGTKLMRASYQQSRLPKPST